MVYGDRHHSRRGSFYDEELDRGHGYYFKHGVMHIPEGSYKENMRKYERDHVEYHQKRMNRSDYGSDEYNYHKSEKEYHEKSLERQERQYRDAKRKDLIRERPRKPVDYENPINKREREKEEERNEKKRNQEKREFKNPLLEKEESEDTVEQSTKKPPSPSTNEEKQIINNSDKNKPETRSRNLSKETPSPLKSDTRVAAESDVPEESFSMFEQTQEGVDDTDNPMFGLTKDSELTKDTSNLEKDTSDLEKGFGDLEEF